VGWKIISGHARIAHPRSAVTTVVCDSLDAHIAAQFSPRAVPVVIEAPEGITVTPSGEFLAGVGDTLSITVERTGAYGVKSWEVTEGRATVHGREAATVVCREPFTIRPVIGPRTYEITLGAGEGGTVGRAGSRRTIHGDPVVLQAHPARNMHFVRWRRRAGFCFIEDDQADSTVAVLTRGDAAVWGEFAAQVCTLDITATSGGHTEPAGIVKAARGSSQLLRAIPNPDAAFLGWRIVESDDSLEFDDSLTVQELTLKNIPGNANIEAEFSTEAVDLTVLSNGLGRTEPSGERTVALRKWSSLKATPAPGQEFVEWTVLSGTGVEFRDRLQPDTQIRIAEGDAIVKALFQPGTGQAGTGHADSSVTVRFMWDPIMGSVDKGASVTVSGTDPVAVTAVPSAGYYFTGWKVRAGAPLITAPFSAGTTVLPGRSDVVLQAVFSPRPVGLLELEFRDHEGRRKTMNVQYR
jgi:hypothetical protein